MQIELTSDATLLIRPESVAEQVALRLLGTRRPNLPTVSFNANGMVSHLELDFDLKGSVVSRPPPPAT